MAGLNKEIEQLELQIKFLEIEIQKANTVNVGLQKQLTLTDVSQQRELLIAFNTMRQFDIKHDDIEESIDYFLKHKESYLQWLTKSITNFKN